jgi:hypothetical protein
MHILVGEPERQVPLELPKRRWKDSIKMDFMEIVLEGVDLIHLAPDRDR